jgi:hypothetical protein
MQSVKLKIKNCRLKYKMQSVEQGIQNNVGQTYVLAKSVVSELARKIVGQRFIFAKCNLKRLPYEKNVIESKLSCYRDKFQITKSKHFLTRLRGFLVFIISFILSILSDYILFFQLTN